MLIYVTGGRRDQRKGSWRRKGECLKKKEKRNPVLERLVFSQLVEQTSKLAGFKVFGVVSLFKLIQFFKHGNGEPNVVLLKIHDGNVFVKDNGGV